MNTVGIPLHNKLVIWLMLLSSLMPYTIGIYGTPFVSLYVLPIIGCFFLLVVNRSVVHFDFIGTTLYLLLLLVCLIPEVLSPNTATLLHFSRYILVGFFLLWFVAPLFCKYVDYVSKIVVLMGVSLSILGMVSAFFGSIEFGPFMIRQYYPMSLFGLTIPTTSSIIWNTNYFGVVQTLTLVFGLYRYQCSHKFSPFLLAANIIIAVSMVLCGSRSVILLLILLIGSYCLIFWRISAWKKGLLIFTIALGLALVNAETVYDLLFSFEDFFTNKGLNRRDEILDAALLAIQAQPWGYGLGEGGDVLLEFGGISTTTQNSALLYFLRGGIAAVVLFVVLLLYSGYRFLSNRQKRMSPGFQVYFAILTVILIDSLVRSYSIGGSGLISMLLTISLGVLWLPNGYSKTKESK